MELKDLMQEIEAHRFSAEVNLAAGSKAFGRALQNHETFRALINLGKEPGASEVIAKRVVDLSGRNVDPQYENQFDAALSAYLTVLRDTAKPEVLAEAASAAATARNCWWTTGLSRELLVRALATGDVSQSAANNFANAITPQEAPLGLKPVNWRDVVSGTPASAQRGFASHLKNANIYIGIEQAKGTMDKTIAGLRTLNRRTVERHPGPRHRLRPGGRRVANA